MVVNGLKHFSFLKPVALSLLREFRSFNKVGDWEFFLFYSRPTITIISGCIFWVLFYSISTIYKYTGAFCGFTVRIRIFNCILLALINKVVFSNSEFSFSTRKTLASLAKWLSVRLWTKWLWVRVQLQSLKDRYSLI